MRLIRPAAAHARIDGLLTDFERVTLEAIEPPPQGASRRLNLNLKSTEK